MNSVIEAEEIKLIYPKPKIRVYFNPTEADGWIAIQLVEGYPPDLSHTHNLDWYRLMSFMPWRLVKIRPGLKGIDEMFRVDKPLNHQRYRK